ncbi:MAG: winged helix-turn-helix domain-containing protein [Chlamydiales bacterium]|nr:winged helix-turn-helix domain-containing protein [Chlamydiales bacterium]
MEVEKLQEQRQGGRVRASDVQQMLEEKFAVKWAQPSIYHLLKRCRLSWISAKTSKSKSS